MSTNVFVRDLDLMGPGVADGRRLEVVVNGLPLFGGSQIAVDTTLVSALHSDGTPLRGAATEDGVALRAAALRKMRRYAELVGPRPGQDSSSWELKSGQVGTRDTNVPKFAGTGENEGRLQAAAAKSRASVQLPGATGADGDTPQVHEVERDLASFLE